MNNFYVMEINSLIRTFEIIETGKSISLNYNFQDNKECFTDICEGDRILGFYSSPIQKVKLEFVVKRVDACNQLELVKTFEVIEGVEIQENDILKELELNGIAKISDDMYNQIRSLMLKGVETSVDIDYLFGLENKDFAMECMRILEVNKALTEETLKVLLDKEKTSQILKNSFPILVKLEQGTSSDEKDKVIRDENGRSRYYPEEFEINGYRYLVTNNWYYNGQNGRDTRTPFVNWIQSVIGKNEKRDVPIDTQYLLAREVELDLTIEQLGKLLLDMYESSDNKSTAPLMFGLKYGSVIKKNGYSVTSIVDVSGIAGSYNVEVSKGVRIYESILENEYGITFYTGEQVDSVEEGNKTIVLPHREPRKVKIYPLNCIIYGAPGTGKTYSTAEYAQAIIEGISLNEFKANNTDRKAVMEKYNKLIEAKQIVFTTFHQSYGYEEFIQGLRPDTKSDKMTFKTVDGVFKQIADKALSDPDKNFVIIIDEINRANISKVFGELITLIEDDKRWGELNQTSATLQSGDLFTVPNNLYIVGTMNSADKSISLIDAALRRRFEFIEQKPDSSLVVDPTLRDILEKINAALANQLDSADLLIGHSYFMGKTTADLPKILNNSIIPLLYEYFYDNKKKVASVLGDAIKNVDYVIEDDKLGRIFVERQK